MRGFWFQKKSVQLKTAFCEVYTYVLKGLFSQKNVYQQGLWPKSVYLKVTVSLKDDVLPKLLTPPKIVLPEKKLSLTLHPLKQMVIITP